MIGVVVGVLLLAIVVFWMVSRDDPFPSPTPFPSSVHTMTVQPPPPTVPAPQTTEPTAPRTTETSPSAVTELISTDGRMRLTLPPSGWGPSRRSREGLLIHAGGSGWNEVSVGTEPWPEGVPVTPQSVLEQAERNGTPPEFMNGEAPTITLLGETAYGLVFDTPFALMYNWYVAPAGGEVYSVIVAADTNDYASADATTGWVDGALNWV